MIESVFTGMNDMTIRAQQQLYLISQSRHQAALEREAKERLKKGFASGFIKREWRLRELNASIEEGNELLKQHQIKEVETIPFPQLFSIGSEVQTAFGIGQVHEYRSKDGIYEIHVNYKNAVTHAVPLKMYLSAIYVLPAAVKK